MRKSPSTLERKFSNFWRLLGGPGLEAEYRFCPTRRWKSDFAHLPTKTLIEIEGGAWSAGRHTRGSGFMKDCEKYLEATLLGWRVMRLSSEQIKVPILERMIQFLRTA